MNRTYRKAIRLPKHRLRRRCALLLLLQLSRHHERVRILRNATKLVCSSIWKSLSDGLTASLGVSKPITLLWKMHTHLSHFASLYRVRDLLFYRGLCRYLHLKGRWLFRCCSSDSQRAYVLSVSQF